ncbi:hypothetical protein [Pontibacter flavimaris]|uniref:hypothetical protein n=1 Tax=Pontibacter flavimaris TaxID=1797110 RepID=UPI00147F8613|nr:hypothetical protein [Pontibacter flavimaris]
MTKLYTSFLLTCGVFLLGLLMYSLRPDTVSITLAQVLPLLLLYAVGVVLGLLIKPVLE